MSLSNILMRQKEQQNMKFTPDWTKLEFEIKSDFTKLSKYCLNKTQKFFVFH